MSQSNAGLNNLCLVKSNEILTVLKWHFDGDFAEFVIDFKEIYETESEGLWRVYGKTMVKCFPIWRKRLANGVKYEFRVLVKSNDNTIEAIYCDKFADITAIEGIGEEFTIEEINNRIIREVSAKSYQYNQSINTIINDKDCIELKSIDHSFSEYESKLWIPFEFYKNPFYKNSANYEQWLFEHKLIANHSKEYNAVVKCMFELFAALTHPKFNELQYKVAVDITCLVFIHDDAIEQNSVFRNNVVKIREALTDVFEAIFGILLPVEKSTAATINDAIIDAYLNIKQRCESLVNNNNNDITEYFEYLYNACSYSVQETHERNTYFRFSYDSIDTTIPAVNHYLFQRFYYSLTKFCFQINQLLLSYEIPYKVKRDENFIKAEVCGVLQVAILNDIFGLFRDESFGDNNSNLVLVLQHYGHMSREDALVKSSEMHDSIVMQFIEAKQCVIHSFRNDTFFTHVIRYIEDIENWMSGHAQWYKQSKRYSQSLLTIEK